MKQLSHAAGCVGFWLWAFVGAAATFAFVSVVGWLLLLPAAGVIYLLSRRSGWDDGPVRLGMITGAGVPLLLVAALNWNDWHHRFQGDNTPNPYDWGGVGLCLLVGGVVAYGIKARRV
jgi:hypothetical protein